MYKPLKIEGLSSAKGVAGARKQTKDLSNVYQFQRTQLENLRLQDMATTRGRPYPY
ncbi:MAG: hypothetical protein QGG39_05175 [Candidatus Poribacteria bacterium]|nr:hypothetical protein [Candidatus Poribacteria bacterium]